MKRIRPLQVFWSGWPPIEGWFVFCSKPLFCVCFLGCFVHFLCTKLISLVIYVVVIYQKKKITLTEVPSIFNWGSCYVSGL